MADMRPENICPNPKCDGYGIIDMVANPGGGHTTTYCEDCYRVGINRETIEAIRNGARVTSDDGKSVVVPVEPTEAMRKAGRNAMVFGPSGHLLNPISSPFPIYRAMITAAQETE